jgi:Rha family phage regulatory protein
MKNNSNKKLGIVEKEGVVYANSRTIAKHFEKEHRNVLRTIDKLVETLLKNEHPPMKYFEEVYAYDKRNQQTHREYNLTRDGFSLLVMGFTGKKALQWKLEYIRAFNEMEQYIIALNTARLEFPELTQAILEVHEKPRHYHFSNEMDLINRIVLGMTAKQYKEAHNLGKVKSIRPYLTAEQLHDISLLQKADIGLVLTEADFQKRKRTLEWYYSRLKLKQIAV